MEQRKVNNMPLNLFILLLFTAKEFRKIISISAIRKQFLRYINHRIIPSEHSDQVKLLKSRKIQDPNPRDTVFLKLKAGVLSALQLDIVKCVPGFLDQTPPVDYTYSLFRPGFL